MVLIDASSRWSHVTLFSSKNIAFDQLLVLSIKLRTQFPDKHIKSIKLDSINELTSHDLCRESCTSCAHTEWIGRGIHKMPSAYSSTLTHTV